jgi:hypothetical protein
MFEVRRREFITLLGGAAAAWPIGAGTQRGGLVRIGALVLTNADAQSLGTALRGRVRQHPARFIVAQCRSIVACLRKASMAQCAALIAPYVLHHTVPVSLFEDAAGCPVSFWLLSAVDGISSCLTSAARRGGTGSLIASYSALRCRPIASSHVRP